MQNKGLGIICWKEAIFPDISLLRLSVWVAPDRNHEFPMDGISTTAAIPARTL